MTEQQETGLARAILGLGEERLGELLSQLMANELFVHAMQNAVTSSLSAKRTVDKNLMRALSMINVPTLEDVEELREKLNALDDVMVEVYQRVQHIHAVTDERLGAQSGEDHATAQAVRPKSRRKKKTEDDT